MTAGKQSDVEIANEKDAKVMNAVNKWCSYYRANPHRFCKDYLNITLKPFQQILIYMMNICTNFMFIAARGLGKSFLCAVFCVCRCILYPDTKIVIVSKTRSQSVNILDEKILKILYPNSENLRAEIKSWTINNQKAEIIFHNGSYIKVVTAADSARGSRANILVCDEFRLLDKDTIDLILKKFLTDPRHPGYLDNPKYAHLLERNKQMYLSSAWFKSHWSWEQCKDYFSMMADPTKKYFCCCFPYQMSIKEGLLMREQVEDDMCESTFSEINFRLEMGAEWIGANEGGLFNFDDLNKARTIRLPFYAPNVALPSSGKLIPPTKKNGEIRILTFDIALMSSKKRDNDATSIMLNCLQPDKNGRCVSNFVYTENIEGMSAPDLALKARKYFDWFDCDWLGIDCKGVGLPIVDLIMHDIYDPETGTIYPAISCYNNPEIAERCPDKNAPKVIWAIMGSLQFNSDVVVALRSGFQQGRIRMLQGEYECEDVLRDEFKGFDKLTPMERAALKLPYLNTGLTVNELVNLGYEATNNVIRVQEKAGCRKDRYSSMSYNYYIAQQIERGLEKRKTRRKKFEFNFRVPTLAKGGV